MECAKDNHVLHDISIFDKIKKIYMKTRQTQKNLNINPKALFRTSNNEQCGSQSLLLINLYTFPRVSIKDQNKDYTIEPGHPTRTDAGWAHTGSQKGWNFVVVGPSSSFVVVGT